MWTLAAVLAWTAVGIRYFGSGEMNWTTAAIGFVCIALGLASWKRRTIDGAPTDPRGTPPSP